MRRTQSEPKAAPGALRAAPESEVARLEREMRTLETKLAGLTEEVGRNDSLLRKTQERELELLRAGSLTQLFERLIVGLRTSYQLDEVALILHDPQHEIRHLLSGDGVTPAFALHNAAVRLIRREWIVRRNKCRCALGRLSSLAVSCCRVELIVARRGIDHSSIPCDTLPNANAEYPPRNLQILDRLRQREAVGRDQARVSLDVHER